MTTEPLLVVLPVNKKDSLLAIKLLQWIQELSGNLRPHSALILVDRSVDQDSSDKLKALASEIFQYTTRIDCQTTEEYPAAATEMFGFAARHVAGAFRLPWLWMEPDCVPLSRMWLYVLAEAYAVCPKRYMGPFVRSDSAEFPRVHLNGVSIYPNDAIKDFQQILDGEIQTPWKSWDMAAHKIVIPRAAETVLIQQFFGKPGLAPSFIDRPKTMTDPENATTTALLDERAVLFHRCKDGSLIDIMRAKRNQKDQAKKEEPQVIIENRPPPITRVKEAALEIS